jgi:hypothetical protein
MCMFINTQPYNSVKLHFTVGFYPTNFPGLNFSIFFLIYVCFLQPLIEQVFSSYELKNIRFDLKFLYLFIFQSTRVTLQFYLAANTSSVSSPKTQTRARARTHTHTHHKMILWSITIPYKINLVILHAKMRVSSLQESVT